MLVRNIKEASKSLWWLVVLAGIASILFGLIAIFWTGLTLATLILLFGIFVIVIGVVMLVDALSDIKVDPLWWLTMLLALFGIAIGIYLVMNPSAAVTLFVALLVLYVFVQSIFSLVVASYAEKGDGRWLWVVTGLVGIILGIFMIIYPITASLATVWVLGLYALVQGIMIIAFAFRVRSRIKNLATKSKKTNQKKKK